MNQAENEASSKAVDSLLNFEQVKYFGNEKHEVERSGYFIKNILVLIRQFYQEYANLYIPLIEQTTT